jgi:hypothetical protein
MTEEQYKQVKTDFVTHVTDFITEMGGLDPHITVFADILDPSDEDEKKPALIHIELSDEIMESDETKSIFVDEMLPKISKKLNEEFKPYAVGWASEAWVRMPGADFDVNKDDYKKLPIKKEVVILTIDTEDKEEIIVYELLREGQQVNQHGDLIPIIKLKELPELNQPSSIGGKFSGLFKKFKK